MTGAVPSGTYDLTIALKTPDGTVAASQDGTFNVPRRGVVETGMVLFEIQAWRVSWSIVKNNAPSSCDQVGAKSVRLTTQLPSQTQPVVFMWPCIDGSGISTAVPIGIYSVKVELLDAANNAVSATSPMTFDARSQLATLPPITFNLN
jgi:hypothetical protein